MLNLLKREGHFSNLATSRRPQLNEKVWNFEFFILNDIINIFLWHLLNAGGREDEKPAFSIYRSKMERIGFCICHPSCPSIQQNATGRPYGPPGAWGGVAVADATAVVDGGW